MFNSPDISNPHATPADISCVWYTIDRKGVLTYTELGDQVYRPLFKSVGVDINMVKSQNDHRDAVQLVVAHRRAKKTG